MTQVSGYSDDLIYIETNGMTYELDVPFSGAAKIQFSDHSRVLFGYKGGVWQASLITRSNTVSASLQLCPFDGENYSDIYETEAEPACVWIYNHHGRMVKMFRPGEPQPETSVFQPEE